MKRKVTVLEEKPIRLIVFELLTDPLLESEFFFFLNFNFVKTILT